MAEHHFLLDITKPDDVIHPDGQPQRSPRPDSYMASTIEQHVYTLQLVYKNLNIFQKYSLNIK